MDHDNYIIIYDKALKLLSRRLHTSAELRKKLLLRKFDSEIVTKVIGDLTKSGLLQDQIFAENFLDSLIKYKSFGFYMLRAKLLQRGISQGLIEGLLAEKLPIEEELKIAKRALQAGKDKVWLAQSLNRKGFRMAVIKQVLNL